jgi:hypothetical protein
MAIVRPFLVSTFLASLALAGAVHAQQAAAPVTLPSGLVY